MGYNIGKPTGDCDQCGATLVRYVEFHTDQPDDVYQACPDCEDV